MAPVFGYWLLRGLGQQIRLLLAYTETEYEEVRYNFSIGPPPPEHLLGRVRDPEGWGKDKFSLGLDVPNLPYYIDDNIKLSQSNSIIRYLAAKHGLAGSSPEEAATADMFSQDLMDLRMDLAMMSYNKEFEQLKPMHLEKLKSKLAQYEAVLEGKMWLLGEKLSYADFVAYEFLDVERLLDAECFSSFPNVTGFLDRFENIPKIKEYMESEKFIRWPVHAYVAQWGGKEEESPFK